MLSKITAARIIDNLDTMHNHHIEGKAIYRRIKRKHCCKNSTRSVYGSAIGHQESYIQIRRKYTNSSEGGYTVWNPDNFIKFMDEVINNA